MALIKCPECNKEISDKAYSCPNCGFPLSQLTASKAQAPAPKELADSRIVIQSLAKSPDKKAEGISIICDVTDMTYSQAADLVVQDVVIVKDDITHIEAQNIANRFLAANINATVYNRPIPYNWGCRTMEAVKRDEELKETLRKLNSSSESAYSYSSSSQHGYAHEKKDDTVCCPKCGSSQIHSGARGHSMISGWFGSGKVMITCLKCGYKWDPAKNNRSSFW